MSQLPSSHLTQRARRFGTVGLYALGVAVLGAILGGLGYATGHPAVQVLGTVLVLVGILAALVVLSIAFRVVRPYTRLLSVA